MINLLDSSVNLCLKVHLSQVFSQLLLWRNSSEGKKGAEMWFFSERSSFFLDLKRERERERAVFITSLSPSTIELLWKIILHGYSQTYTRLHRSFIHHIFVLTSIDMSIDIQFQDKCRGFDPRGKPKKKKKKCGYTFGVLEEEERRKADEIFRVIISVISGYSLTSKQENSFGYQIQNSGRNITWLLHMGGKKGTCLLSPWDIDCLPSPPVPSLTLTTPRHIPPVTCPPQWNLHLRRFYRKAPYYIIYRYSWYNVFHVIPWFDICTFVARVFHCHQEIIDIVR